MNDPAGFHEATVTLIYGHSPSCFLCGQCAADAHHIVSRGYKYGAAPKSERRDMFSSVLNYAPLCKKHHEWGKIHWKQVERQLLDKSLIAVRSCEQYRWNNDDRAFFHNFYP